MDKSIYDRFKKSDEIWRYSNPTLAQLKAHEIYGPYATLFRSNRKDKKYCIENPLTHQFTHFGQMGYEDFLKHKDKERQKNFFN